MSQNSQLKSLLSKLLTKQVLVFLLVLILGAAALFYLFLRPSVAPLPELAETYTLAEDKISTGADIAINLPEDVDSEAAKKNIVFDPEIDGGWLESKKDDQLLFRPDEELTIGMYYSVALKTEKGEIEKDFQIVEAPRVVAVFPAEGTETHENSEITIVFNRPMVPLTTLDKLDEFEIPVEIMPATEGKWKWIGTRTLQFQPEERLQRSSNYQVTVKPGFVSQDGLKLEGLESSFQTRPLRYSYVSQGEIVYSKPIRIAFNQPIDLEKTRKEIALTLDDDIGKNIDFIAEYAKRKIKGEESEDQSTILIYQKNDQHGRSKLWDFENDYRVIVGKAYPLEGDIILDEVRESNIQVTKVVKNIYTSSERSYYSDLNFFDPEGLVWIEFYEDIDLSRSEIKSDKLLRVEYGEKCKEGAAGEWVEYNSDVECEKETDKQKIYLEFKTEKINSGEQLNIKLQAIKNAAGQTVNYETLEYSVRAMPKLSLLRIFPDGEKAAELNEMIVCSTTPLAAQDKKDIDKYIDSSEGYKFRSWHNSYLVISEADNTHEKCQPGEFATRINYKLAPQKDYKIKIKVEDVFGAEAEKTIDFHTGKMPDSQLNFYHLQSKYNVATPGKSKMTFAVENMDFVVLDICELSAADMLRYLNDKPYYTDSHENVNECVWRATTQIDLPKKYWDKNYFQVNVADYTAKEKGHYLLTFSHPNYRERWGRSEAERRRIFERSYISITDLGVVEKEAQIYEYSSENLDRNLSERQKSEIKNFYWVNNLQTLQPISDASLDFYKTKSTDSDGSNEILVEKTEQATTNKLGVAETSVVVNPVGVVVSKADDSAIIPSRDSSLYYSGHSYNAKRVYLYTDRPIYRPGDEVQLKGIYRRGYDGDLDAEPGRKIELEVRNSDWDEILTKELTLNEFGTFDTSFFLDANAPLGSYNIYTEGGRLDFDVEEYVPAPFKVESTLNQEEYIAGDELEMLIDAEYYFGVPLESGTVTYTVSSQDYYFDKYKGEYFDFGSGWYGCWYGCDYGDKFILRNSVKLDSEGKAKIQQDLDFQKFFKEEEDRKSKIMVISATVQNPNGQSVTTRKSFIVHGGEYYLGVKPDPNFSPTGKEFKLRVKSVDTEGKETSVSGIKLTVSKVKWIESRRKEVDGGYYYRWEKQLTPKIEKKFSTSGSGNWDDDFTLDEPGEYEVTVSASDDRGNKISSTYEIYIYEGEGSAGYDSGLVRQRNDTWLELVTENSSVKPGDTASLIIKNPFKKAKALIAIERGKIFDYEIIDIDQSLFKYDFKVTEEHIPNIFVSVTLLSADPAVKHGNLNFRVDSGAKELDIQVKADKEKYLPGEEVTLDFTVLDSEGKPIETELSAAVVDLSVLALKGNPKKSPVVFFYNYLPLTIETSSNLKNILNEIEIQDGKGGGGGPATDTKTRGEFKDTAFWQAVIQTDAKGKASVTFTLPDNLTSWQVESVGISKDSKIGAAYEEFTTRKELMLIPIKPRFVIPGDELSLGAKVFNQSDESQSLEVEFQSETLQVDDAQKKVSLGAGETRIINFAVKVPEEQKTGMHSFTLSAANENLNDTVVQKIKITRNDTYEATATANYSKNNKISEYIYLPENIIKEKGSLTINSSATLAVFLSDGLNSLLAFPYGCTEQIASKLDAMAIIKKGLKLENIGDKFEIEEIDFDGEKYTLDEALEKGLARLYENHNSDGGFAYYNNWESNYHLTLRIAQTLINLKQAGVDIDESKLSSAFDFISNKIKYDPNLRKNRRNLIVAAAVFSADSSGQGYLAGLVPQIKEKILGDTKFIREEIGNISLATLATLMAENPDIFSTWSKNQVYNTLENRMRIDARGAYLSAGEDRFWQYYETSEKDTALLLKALVADNRDNEVMGRILRWLLRSRAKDGAWGSTSNTLSVIDAFTDYLVWSEENEADFSLDIVLDGESLTTFDFTPETILDQPSLKIEPLAEIPSGKLLNLDFVKNNRNDLKTNVYYDIALKYFLPIDSIPPRDEGFTISREFYALDDLKNETPIREAKVGDVLRGHLEIIVPEQRNFVAIEDFIPAGTELINFDLETEDHAMVEYMEGEEESDSDYYDYHEDYSRYSRTLYPRKKELRDDRIFMFDESLPAGTYTFDYYVRVLVPGKFHHLPAVISEMYFPENFGRTRGAYFEVEE